MSKKIYIASPFFNGFELGCVERAEDILISRGFEVFSPRLHEVREDREKNPSRWSSLTFENDRQNIDSADIVIALYHGAYSDSGTAWECGYAYAKGKTVVVVHVNGDSDSNLMVHEGCRTNINIDELEIFDFEALPVKKYSGKMF